MDQCLFCKIVAGGVPADFVHQDEDLVAFRDINPQAPVHFLVVPRRHISGFDEATESDHELLGKLARTAAVVAARQGIGETGFRCVVNRGSHGQQSVPHLHMHVMGGRQMSWPPG